MSEETTASTLKLGFEAKLFCGEAGTKPTEEMDNVKDLALDLSASEVDATTRAMGGWKAVLRGLKDVSVEWKSNWDPEDEFLQDCLQSFLEGTPLAFFISDGDGYGIDGDFQVMKFPNQQDLDNAQEITISIKPHAGASRVPTWVEPAAPST